MSKRINISSNTVTVKYTSAHFMLVSPVSLKSEYAKNLVKFKESFVSTFTKNQSLVYAFSTNKNINKDSRLN